MPRNIEVLSIPEAEASGCNFDICIESEKWPTRERTINAKALIVSAGSRDEARVVQFSHRDES